MGGICKRSFPIYLKVCFFFFAFGIERERVDLMLDEPVLGHQGVRKKWFVAKLMLTIFSGDGGCEDRGRGREEED